MSQTSLPRDNWSTESYSAAASFVPNLTHKLLQYLDAKPDDKVLDIGCGDGKFTAKYLDSVKEVYGLDASPSLIASANQNYESSKASFKVLDCRYLERDPQVQSGEFDKVISNAALHWILTSPSTRHSTLRACFTALRPGGLFVFEMGGVGNVAEVHTALLSALVYPGGLTIEEARAADPWFFPDEGWMRSALEGVGFEIERDGVEMEARPTRLTGGGLRSWVELMGAEFLERVEMKWGDDGGRRRREVVEYVCEVLKTVVTREKGKDGESEREEWLGYVRLRGVARRPL